MGNEQSAEDPTIMEVHGQGLTSITIEEGVVECYCERNQLEELPAIPTSVRVLQCADNKLTKLPKLHEGLTKLYCYGNQITEITELPSTLEVLRCDHNALTKLELPPNLKYLECHHNNLTVLPKLPQSLSIVCVSHIREWMCENPKNE